VRDRSNDIASEVRSMAISDAGSRAERRAAYRLRTNLSPEEQSLRGRISIGERWGHETTAQRKQLAELIATREFREAAVRLVAARQSQGFPDKVSDVATLARIATLIAEPENRTAGKASSPLTLPTAQPITTIDGGDQGNGAPPY
jgi:hypothetical protein